MGEVCSGIQKLTLPHKVRSTDYRLKRTYRRFIAFALAAMVFGPIFLQGLYAHSSMIAYYRLNEFTLQFYLFMSSCRWSLKYAVIVQTRKQFSIYAALRVIQLTTTEVFREKSPLFSPKAISLLVMQFEQQPKTE